MLMMGMCAVASVTTVTIYSGSYLYSKVKQAMSSDGSIPDGEILPGNIVPDPVHVEPVIPEI